ncbi:MAG TPA: DUF2909 domain-containing protein [Pseudomonadales bacterium]|nr:DUF2909 domain-containing protein [Pseudomonadales bacterium]
MSALQLKSLIAVLMFLMVISLFNGLFVLFKDNGAPESKRTYHRLVLRVTLAAALLGTMIYGFYSGKLASHAPWNRNITIQKSISQ